MNTKDIHNVRKELRNKIIHLCTSFRPGVLCGLKKLSIQSQRIIFQHALSMPEDLFRFSFKS